jgi:diaminohydroxyphosphoribosylaminopyrimidine deaminase/5-amino-6-(5-phosphoribosylamino)uracil reductase
VSGAGVRQLVAAGIDVEGGVMADSAAALNIGFMRRMQTGRPYVRSKIAASLDGRTALENGTSRWITGTPARADVQRLRARSSAVLTGIGTILSDNPSLNVRDIELDDVCQPLRVIADSRLRTPVDAKTIGLPGPVRIYCIDDQAAEKMQAEKLVAAGAEVEVVVAQGGHVSLPALLDSLGELQINELLVEAGPGLNGALLAAGMIDELIVYAASHILGSGARGMFDGPSLQNMDERVELQLVDMRRVGDDCRLTYRKV